MRLRFLLASVPLLAVCVLAPTVLLAEASGPAYSFNNLSIDQGPNSYTGRFAGDDMLPYTDDDFDVDGNPRGSLGFEHMDANADNKIQEDEFIFHSVRNADDDSTFYAPQSRPEYGTLYESEDWTEYHEANFRGPNGINVLDDTNLTDFEVNDWDGWTDESNAYIYNNLGNNQHGHGYSKYRVDYRSVPLEGQEYVFDEVEGWKKSFGLRNTGDDPNTQFVENGSCRRFDRSRDEIDLRGYMIPTDELASLQNGSLDPLFPDWMQGSTVGGEPTDMAAYFRDTLAPVLEDPNLFIFCECGLGPAELLPASYVYLLQYEIELTIDNAEGECGGSSFDELCVAEPDPALCQLAGMQAAWGLQTGDKMRRSFVTAGSPDLADVIFGPDAVHPFQNIPDDDAELNLWVQDHFWRDGDEPLGVHYASVGDVDIVTEPGLTVVDRVNDAVLRLKGAASISAEFPKPLGLAETPILVAADLAIDTGDLTLGGPAGIGDGYQLILRSGNAVVAYADITLDQTQVHLGGTYNPATGLASNPAASGEAGSAADISEVDTVSQIGGDYTRYVLMVTRSGASLREITGVVANDFSGLMDPAPIATVAGAPSLGNRADHATITSGAQSVVNTFLVFARPGIGPFIRGDCNQDGGVDLSDGVFGLNFVFQGGEMPSCLAACDNNGDGFLDITNAIFVFNFLFQGGPPIAPPTRRAEYSQRDTDGALGCEG